MSGEIVERSEKERERGVIVKKGVIVKNCCLFLIILFLQLNLITNFFYEYFFVRVVKGVLKKGRVGSEAVW